MMAKHEIDWDTRKDVPACDLVLMPSPTNRRRYRMGCHLHVAIKLGMGKADEPGPIMYGIAVFCCST